MSDFEQISIQTEAEFLAHVIALKGESEERLQVMADSLSAHNNPDAAEIFQTLADFIGQTVAQLEAQAAGMQLPEIPPWEYQWHCSTDPETLCMDHAHYLMSIRQALQLALFNEKRSLDFFKRVYEHADHLGVMDLAQQQIKIEQQFEAFIQQRLATLEEDEYFNEDLDPPNIPE